MCSGGSRAERAGGGHHFGWVCLQEVGVAAAAFAWRDPCHRPVVSQMGMGHDKLL